MIKYAMLLATVFAAWIFGLTATATAAAIPTPIDLSPGENYRLIFVTSSGRDATSTAISEYDAFVQGVADSAGIGASQGVTWQAIVSTDVIAAADHIGTFSEPVYNMNIGEDRVANDSADLFDANLANYINRDELNNTVSGVTPWTGSGAFGEKADDDAVLGSTSGVATTGIAPALDSSWLTGSDLDTAEVHPFYAISSTLTVPNLPEPSALALALLLVTTLSCSNQRRKPRISVV